MNEDNLNKNKGRPKKKRSKSAQEGRSDVKKLKVDGPPGTNTVGQARRLNQYGRRSQVIIFLKIGDKKGGGPDEPIVKNQT